jgi:hypothetical protein
MNKTELLTKGIEMDYEEKLINEQKTHYINTLLKKEEILIKQFSEFFNTFLTEDVFKEIEKINYPNNRQDDYVWINTPLIRLNYYYKWSKIKINVENDKNIIPLTNICDIRTGDYSIIGTKWIASIPCETSTHFIEQKADELKAFEKMYNDFKKNVQTFYNKIGDRRYHKIEDQQKFLSSLPQFDLEEEPQKLYKIKITFEEIN